MIDTRIPRIRSYMNLFRFHVLHGNLEKAISFRDLCRELSREGIEEHRRIFDNYLEVAGKGVRLGKEEIEYLMDARRHSLFCEDVLFRINLGKFYD